MTHLHVQKGRDDEDGRSKQDSVARRVGRWCRNTRRLAQVYIEPMNSCFTSEIFFVEAYSQGSLEKALQRRNWIRVQSSGSMAGTATKADSDAIIGGTLDKVNTTNEVKWKAQNHHPGIRISRKSPRWDLQSGLEEFTDRSLLHQNQLARFHKRAGLHTIQVDTRC